jgi:hypothetical protein
MAKEHPGQEKREALRPDGGIGLKAGRRQAGHPGKHHPRTARPRGRAGHVEAVADGAGADGLVAGAGRPRRDQEGRTTEAGILKAAVDSRGECNTKAMDLHLEVAYENVSVLCRGPA